MFQLSRISSALARGAAASCPAAPPNGMPSLSEVNKKAAIKIGETIHPGYRLPENTDKLATSLCPVLDEHAESLVRGAGKWNDKDQRNAWFADQTALMLKNLANFTSRQYCPLARDMPFESAILPAHFALLEETVRESYASLGTSDKIKMAASVEPGVLESCGVQISGGLRGEIARQRNRNFQRLTKAEMLALVDYAHMDTRTFVVVNSCARLSHYFNFSAMADVIHCMDGPRKSAISKLAKNPDWIKSGDMYKGVDFENPSGYLALANLKRSLGSGNALTLPHMTSATPIPSQSYAHRRGYDTEIVFKECQAIDISIFHHQSTADQSEVLILDNVRLRMTGIEAVQLDTNEGPKIIDRFIAKCEYAAHTGPQ